MSSKCKVCDKTAYPIESISYDNMVYHKTCFKCLQCGSSVSLKKVAMIQGDLYCKNCFIRMFSEKGNYKVFAEAGKGDRPSHSAQPSFDASSVDPTIEAQATANYLMKKGRRGSVVSCLMDGCGKPRAAGVNYCLEHQRSQSDDEHGALIKAINEKSVKDVKAILQKDGVKIAIKPNSKRQTAVEIAFTSGNNALGVVMLEMINERVNHLEEQLRTLQEQVELIGPEKIIRAKSATRPRRNSAPREQTEAEDDNALIGEFKQPRANVNAESHPAPAATDAHHAPAPAPAAESHPTPAAAEAHPAPSPAPAEAHPAPAAHPPAADAHHAPAAEAHPAPAAEAPVEHHP